MSSSERLSIGGEIRQPRGLVIAEVLAGERLETVMRLPGDAEIALAERVDQSAGDLDRLVMPQRVGGGDANVAVVSAVVHNFRQGSGRFRIRHIYQRLGRLQPNVV